MATSNGKILRFPLHLFEESKGAGDSSVIVTETEGDEYRAKIGTRRRRASVSTGKMTNAQHDEFQTFCDLLEDSYNSFLFLDMRRYRLDNELFAHGDGATKTFQLTRTRTLEGQTKTLPVYCPDHAYPPRFLPAAPGVSKVQYWPRPGEDGLLHIFVKVGAAMIEYSIDVSTPEKLDLLRYGGMVTLNNAPPNGAEIRVRGYFYHLMRMTSGSPETSPLGGGFWTISDGISMVEPKNVVKELAEIRSEI